MSREKQIRLSEHEKALLADLKERRFGDCPYGYVVAELVRFYQQNKRDSNVKL